MRACAAPFRIFSAGIFAAVVAFAIAQGPVAPRAEDVKPIEKGKPLPKTMVKDLEGKDVALKDALGNKPTVLIFYRGGWCPFCNAHLSKLQTIEGDLKELGYQVVAVSPDRPEELKKSIEKNKLSYTLLSDSDANAIRALGLAFKLEAELVETYRDRYGIDIEKASGKTHHYLPVPAVFLVDKSGVIRYVFAKPDYKVRLEPAELLAEAKKVASDR